MACRWQEKMLIHGEGDRYSQSYRLLPWQREFNWRWWELDPVEQMGAFWYLEALIGAERGAVKTEFLGAHAMTEMAGPKRLQNSSATPLVAVGAASLGQAGEMFRQIQIMAGGAKGQEIPEAPLFGLFEVLDTTIKFADGKPGRIERIAADAGTAEGGKTSLALADELAQWTGNRAKVYDVMKAATTKRLPPGRTIGISMPGELRGATPFVDDDPLLWKLYVRGLTESQIPNSRYLFDWITAPRVDWKDPTSIEVALRTMRGADVTWSVAVRLREIVTRNISQRQAQRLYLCQWPSLSTKSWLSEYPDVWEECGTDDDGQWLEGKAWPVDGQNVVVGVDMALHNDHVGIVVAGVLSDGRVGWWSRSFAPVDGRIDHLDVFATIAGLIAQRWKIQSVVYDPRFFEIPARLLEDQGIAVIEFPQSPERLIPADDLLLQTITNHQLVHANDPILNAHCEAAAWRDSDRGRYLAKSKTQPGLQMDLIRAGAMATWELLAGEPMAAPATATAVVHDAREIFRPSSRLNL